MSDGTILIFYGFSSNQRRPTPEFPDGHDHDRTYEITAQTLSLMLKKKFPAADVRPPIQAWTKSKILNALMAAPTGSISQVHIVCHADSVGLYLASHFDGDQRILARARRFNGLEAPDPERTRLALLDEDAWLATFASRGLSPEERTLISSKHAADSVWQLWGCYAGFHPTRFQAPGPSEVARYFRRFNLGANTIDGIAFEIATRFGVRCTAAVGHGVVFWHRTRAGHVVKNQEKTAARPPYFAWLKAGGSPPPGAWITYGRDGSLLPMAIVLGEPKPAGQLLPGKPPPWLTDLAAR